MVHISLALVTRLMHRDIIGIRRSLHCSSIRDLYHMSNKLQKPMACSWCVLSSTRVSHSVMSANSYLPLDSDAPAIFERMLLSNYARGEWCLRYDSNTGSHISWPVAFIVRTWVNNIFLKLTLVVRSWCCTIILSLWTKRYDAYLSVYSEL